MWLCLFGSWYYACLFAVGLVCCVVVCFVIVLCLTLVGFCCSVVGLRFSACWVLIVVLLLFVTLVAVFAVSGSACFVIVCGGLICV